MMKGSFTARTPLSLAAWEAGPEFEAEMVVKFTVCPGCAETLTEPGEPPFAEDISIRLFTTKTKTELPCPAWLHEYFADDEAFREWLCSEIRAVNDNLSSPDSTLDLIRPVMAEEA